MKLADKTTAYATSLRRGVVGRNAIIPRLVAEAGWVHLTVLDFGAGRDAYHTGALRSLGFDVTAYEFPEFADPIVHDVNALDRKYGVVMASNVINTLQNAAAVVETLQQIAKAVDLDGMALINYPATPSSVGSSSMENHGTCRRDVWSTS